MSCAASRIVKSVLCFKRIDADSYFSWQAQHLVTLEDDLSRIVNSLSCFKRIGHESYFSWRAQHLVTLEHGLCRSSTL